jgi:hypothetical protein
MSETPEFMQISLQDTLSLVQQPGKVSIVIKQMENYCMPFVFVTPPEQPTQGLGIIVHEGNFLATQDANDLASELQAIFQNQVSIILPAQTPPPTKH